MRSGKILLVIYPSVYGLLKRKKCRVGTWFYASGVDWVLRCGCCTQKMEADEHELTEAEVKWTKCLDKSCKHDQRKVSFSPGQFYDIKMT